MTSDDYEPNSRDEQERLDRLWLRAQTAPVHSVTIVRLSADHWLPTCHLCGALGDYPAELGARFAEQTHEKEFSS